MCASREKRLISWLIDDAVSCRTTWAPLSRVVAEGKTKTVEDAGNGEVFVRGKDDFTAGDGAKHG